MRNEKQMRISPDALIALVAVEAEAREQKRISRLEAEESETERSLRFTQRMSRLLKKFHSKQRAAKIRKGVKSALIAATASVSLFSLALFPFESVRGAVRDTVIVWRDRCASFILQDERLSIQMPVDVEVTYTPDEYTLQSQRTFEENGYFQGEYIGPDECWYIINVDYLQNANEVVFDNEHTRFYSLEFAGRSAVLAVGRDVMNAMLWQYDGLSFFVSGTVELSEMLKIAEGIEITR